MQSPAPNRINPWLQAVLLGAGLFAISLLVRAAADTLVGGTSAGPTTPEAVLEARDAWSRFAYGLLIGVLLPALVETPFVVWVVRRARSDARGIGLVVVIGTVFAAAWLLHGASPGSVGQGLAFALMAYAAWGWGRRFGRWRAYALPIVSHAVWNGIGLAILLVRQPV